MPTQAEAEWRPRLSIDITTEQAEALGRLIPWGMRKMVYSALTDMLIEALQKAGPEVLLSVIQKELDLPAIFTQKKEA